MQSIAKVTFVNQICKLSLYFIGLVVDIVMIIIAIRRIEKNHNIKWYRSQRTSIKMAIISWINIATLSATQLALSTNIIIPFDVPFMDSYICDISFRSFLVLVMGFYAEAHLVFSFSLQELYEATKIPYSKSFFKYCKVWATVPLWLFSIILNIPQITTSGSYRLEDNNDLLYCDFNSSQDISKFMNALSALGFLSLSFLILMLVLFLRALKTV